MSQLGALNSAIQRFPKVGSQVVQFERKFRFHLDTKLEQTKLRLLIVKREYLADIHD
jgi:hypothetical protein